MLSSPHAVKPGAYPGIASLTTPPAPLNARLVSVQVQAGAYGMRMARHLHLAAAPTISVRTRRKATLAVTRLRSESTHGAPGAPLAPEPAFTVQLHLRASGLMKVWLGGQQTPMEIALREGSVTICHLEKAPCVYLDGAFDVLQFYVSRAALDEFADENDACRAQTLSWPDGKPDPNLRNFGNCLLPALDSPDTQAEWYLEHLVLAAHAYIARAYGGIRAMPAVARGGLAPWQVQKATEILRANLTSQVSLTYVAAECKLSVSHFVRAFKRTMGEPPYRWLLQQRIALAKELLLHSSKPMVEIALKCGFADQACFIRAFRKTLDSTPGEWRRMRLQ